MNNWHWCFCKGHTELVLLQGCLGVSTMAADIKTKIKNYGTPNPQHKQTRSCWQNSLEPHCWKTVTAKAFG